MQPQRSLIPPCVVNTIVLTVYFTTRIVVLLVCLFFFSLQDPARPYGGTIYTGVSRSKPVGCVFGRRCRWCADAEHIHQETVGLGSGGEGQW